MVVVHTLSMRRTPRGTVGHWVPSKIAAFCLTWASWRGVRECDTHSRTPIGHWCLTKLLVARARCINFGGAQRPDMIRATLAAYGRGTYAANVGALAVEWGTLTEVRAPFGDLVRARPCVHDSDVASGDAQMSSSPRVRCLPSATRPDPVGSIN